MSDNGDQMDMNGEQNDENNENEEKAPKYRNLTAEKLEEIDDIFELFDKDKDGLISIFDFQNMLRWLAFNPTGREMEAYAEKYDKDKSGLVNVRTVKEVVDKKTLEPDTIEELIEAMKILDTNNDGTIQIPELRWALTQLGDSMDQVAVDEMIKMIDEDNKGFVDIMEFSKMCFNIKEKKKD